MLSNSVAALRDCSNMSQNSANSSQKRQASPSSLSEGAAGGTKRSRPNHSHSGNTTEDMNTAAATATTSPPRRRQHDTNVKTHEFISNDSSVESLLSVPLNVIFRKVVPATAGIPQQQQQQLPQQKRKQLLTRAEAQCLTKTAQLAHQIDAIVQVSSNALVRQQWCGLSALVDKESSASISQVPLLRSVLPLLHVHGESIPSRALAHVQEELNHALVELEACSSALSQYSEQNWTLSESLLDAFQDAAASTDASRSRSPPPSSPSSSGHELAKGKRIMAEIEEEVATRIGRLLKMAADPSHDDSSSKDTNGITTEAWWCEDNDNDAFAKATDSESGRFVSMSTFCYRLFGMENGQDTAAVPEHADDENGNSTSAGDQHRVSSAHSEEPEQQQQPQESPDNEEEEDEDDEHHKDDTGDRLRDLAKEAASAQWSASTATMHTPEHDFSANGQQVQSLHDRDEGYMEMTQGTSNAVEALTVLASGSRGDSRRMDQG